MKKFFESHKGILKKVGCLAMAVVIAGTGAAVSRNSSVSDIPELVTFVDPETVQVQQEEVPLASGTKTTRKVSTRTTTKKITMPKKAKKTSTTTTKTTNNSTKTVSKNIQRIKTNTKIDTTIKTKTKKNSKIKTTQTKVVTTVTTTTTTVARTTSAGTAQADNSAKQTKVNVRSAASAADRRVLNAFESMGFQVVIDPTVSYSGCFDARKRTITLRKQDSTIYHELGHFVEFVGGNASVKNAITKAYQSEKSKYTASNKAYILQNSSEYFAESFKNYCENPGALQRSRPNTYNAVVQALSVMTDSRVAALKNVYAAVWK